MPLLPLLENLAVLPLNPVTSYLSVAMLTALVYSRLHGTYLDDDQMAILGVRDVVGCTHISQLFDPQRMQSIWDNDFWGVPMAMNISHKSWRPLTTLTFRAGWCFHGDNVLWFVRLLRKSLLSCPQWLIDALVGIGDSEIVSPWKLCIVSTAM